VPSLFDRNIKFFHIGKNLLILGLNLDPDPELDPDLHSSKSLDLDPHIMNADLKQWLCLPVILVLFTPFESRSGSRRRSNADPKYSKTGHDHENLTGCLSPESVTVGWAAAGRVVMNGGGSFQAGPLEVEGVWPGPPWSGVCWNAPTGGSGRAEPPVLDWLVVRDRAGKSRINRNVRIYVPVPISLIFHSTI
jgi:hypothetical protein